MKKKTKIVHNPMALIFPVDLKKKKKEKKIQDVLKAVGLWCN